MTITDPIGDMFTRIRNGQMRSLNRVDVPASKFRSQILEILKSEGYITNFKLDTKDNSKIFSVYKNRKSCFLQAIGNVVK